MKEWLRITPIFLLFFCVLTFLDYVARPEDIRWLLNFGQSFLLTAIGCVGQYLIHKNVLKDEEEENDSDGCINCTKP